MVPELKIIRWILGSEVQVLLFCFRVNCVIHVMSNRGGNWAGCVVTCSTVRGEQISSPLRIMERWVNTSDNWKESRPSSSLTLLTTETNTSTHRCTQGIYHLRKQFRWLLFMLNNRCGIYTAILYHLQETLLCRQVCSVGSHRSSQVLWKRGRTQQTKEPEAHVTACLVLCVLVQCQSNSGPWGILQSHPKSLITQFSTSEISPETIGLSLFWNFF